MSDKIDLPFKTLVENHLEDVNSLLEDLNDTLLSDQAFTLNAESIAPIPSTFLYTVGRFLSSNNYRLSQVDENSFSVTA